MSNSSSTLLSHDRHKFRPVIIVTTAYFIVYYIFLYSQSLVKRALYSRMKAKAKKDGQDKIVSFKDFKYASTDRFSLLLDRSVGNTIEQAIPFLTALWIHAVFVSVDSAAFAGWIYVIARTLYPAGFYLGLPFVLLSTVPGYACIIYLLYTACY